jgi:hypothetical protein
MSGCADIYIKESISTYTLNISLKNTEINGKSDLLLILRVTPKSRQKRRINRKNSM